MTLVLSLISLSAIVGLIVSCRVERGMMLPIAIIGLASSVAMLDPLPGLSWLFLTFWSLIVLFTFIRDIEEGR